MNLRTRIRRWWIGPDLYDFAVISVRSAESADQAGVARAEAFLRELVAHAYLQETP